MLSFSNALSLAQQLGFAESDPALDIEGVDSLNKWIFLLTHAYGILPKPGELLYAGIQRIKEADAKVAQEKKMEIKLVAHSQKLKNGSVAAFVLPQWVSARDTLAFLKEEYNGVVIESSFADKQFFMAKALVVFQRLLPY